MTCRLDVDVKNLDCRRYMQNMRGFAALCVILRMHNRGK